MAKSKKNKWENWTEKDYQKEIDSLRKKKTYGLVWEEDKTKEAFDYYINWEGEQTKETFGEEDNKFPVLKEVKNKAIDNKDPKYNLLIEGDNYHSLAVLNFTHNKAVDVIYIDPPYNTGNKDFKYNDNWVDKEDGYRHSKYLSFMSKRLKLARNLLKPTGAIFISIDQNEIAQLKLLCDGIYGENNFVNILVWKKTNSPKSQSNSLGNQHEYILVYARDINKLELNKYAGEIDDNYKKSFRYDNKDGRGSYQTIALSNKTTMGGFGKMKEWEWRGVKARWIYSKEKLENWWKEGKIHKTKTGYRLKDYLKDRKGKLLSDIWIDDEIKALQGGTGEYIGFATQKPLSLLRRILKLFDKKNIIVLDFFAGSGTTGHATMLLNQEDEGKRKFILCTNNEDNNGDGKKIAEDICYPRLKNSIKGINGKGKSEKPIDENLKYYKHDFIESAPTDQNKKKIVDKSTEMLCIKENAFKPIKEKEGYKIFKNTDIHLGIIFDEEEINEFIKDAKEIKGKFHVYVFSLDNSIPEKEFKTMKGKVKLCAIPEAILHVYRRIFK
jgi:adenine-specific DNA-methyltransferase